MAFLMDIGKESEPYVIEPLEDPVPNREPAPAPEEPVYAPDREKVPA